MSQTIRLKEVQCPNCSSKLNAATSIEKNIIPKPGDITICVNCSEVLEFKADMTIQLISEENIIDVDLIELQKLQKAIRSFHEHRTNKNER